MRESPYVVVAGSAEYINMFIKGQYTIKSNPENFDVRGDGNRADSCIDTSKRRKSVRSLPRAEDNGIGLVWVQGKAIETEPDVKKGETLFKFTSQNSYFKSLTLKILIKDTKYNFRNVQM